MKTYVARDKDGTLYIYSIKPKKCDLCWYLPSGVTCCEIKESVLPQDVNPQWEDEEPIEVKFKIEKA